MKEKNIVDMFMLVILGIAIVYGMFGISIFIYLAWKVANV